MGALRVLGIGRRREAVHRVLLTLGMLACLAPAGSTRADAPATSGPGLPAAVTLTTPRSVVEGRGATVVVAKVVDVHGAPLAGVLVRFSFVDDAHGAVVTPTGITNADGLATATVQAGSAPGAVTIRAEAEGGEKPAGVVTFEISPPAPHLSRNYFNPSKGERLRIAVDVPEPARVSVSVVGMSGEMVREIDSSQVASGPLSREWDGRTATGETAPSGIYFVRVQNGNSLQIRRVIVLKI